MLNSTPVDLRDYQLDGLLARRKRTMVYRGRRRADGRAVTIKVLNQEHPSFDELVRFRNQYAIARHLDHPGILAPMALERYGNGYALVLPDDGWIALPVYWQQQHRDIGAVLAIACQLAAALHYLNQQRVIHKDIKPDNILIHPETGQVKLIDFSIASLLPKEHQQLANPHALEGTLAYMSPEQTGRMNRGLDYRTDFYSLGVTLFELLVGELPFAARDALELVHCHLARPVVFPAVSQPPLPAMVQAIVLKLLAKNAEARYQSALGLQHDLERCQQQWQARGDIPAFELGGQDTCDRFLIPEQLYGREAEVQTLLAAFERVARGSTELALVAGFSGVGKTAVISEVYKPITRQKGYFSQGKFDQFNRNVPFSAFVQAFRSLIGQLLGESDVALANWRAKILKALGTSGQILIDVIPELERIIGPQPTTPELSSSAAQNRFNRLFGQFVRIFTAPEHPLTIFLDDLQWADLASLHLLKLLVGESASGYLFLLGAYRDNEVFPAHPLMLTLADLKKQGVRISTLALAPLNQANITHLVADTLLCSTDIVAPLSELVYQKTRGNPFFTMQFLQGLYAEGCITFHAGYWQCDLVRLRQLSLTSDVVEFTIERLRKLPDATQAVLKFAACIGNRFELSALAVVCDRPPDIVAADLWAALQAGLIVPDSETYKFFQGDRQAATPALDIRVGYRFLHDRVQQAAYNLIPDDRKPVTHLAIGRLLRQDAARLDDHLFEIVNHWNIAANLIETADEKVQLAALNGQAGDKAKASTAYEPALKYFTTGLALLDGDRWQTQYELTLHLHLGAAKAASLHGDYAQMECWSGAILRHSSIVLDRVRAYDIQIQAQMAQAKPAVAIQIALEALALLQIDLAEAPSATEIATELQNTRQLWQDHEIAALENLPRMTEPEKIAALVILSSIFSPSFIAKPEILPLIACRQIQLSLQYGNHEHSAFGYSNYSAILSTLANDLDASYQFGQLAIALVEKLAAEPVKARTFNQAAIFSMHGKVHLRDVLPILKEGCHSGIENGDLEFAGYAAYNWSQYAYFSGMNLIELQADTQKHGILLEKVNQNISLSYNQLVQQAALNLIGESEFSSHLQGQVFDEKKELADFIANQVLSGIQYLFVHKLFLCLVFSEQAEILDYVEQAERYLSASTGMILVPICHFLATLARLQVYPMQSSENQVQLLARINRGITQIQQWAKQAPMNFQHKLDLMRAERWRVLGKPYRAADYYDRAIAGARANDYIQDEAIAHEWAAKFYLERGRTRLAASYFQDACFGYARWGAKAKLRQLERDYTQFLLADEPLANPAAAAVEPSTSTAAFRASAPLESSATLTASSTTSTNAALDFLTILRASQAISSTIDLAELLGQLAQILLQNSGGDRCAILLGEPDGRLWLRAIAQLETVDVTAIALEATADLPIQLIQYAKRTRETVVMDRPERELPVFDRDLAERQPASVLCLPLIERQQLRGLLYLENQTTSSVFPAERLAALNWLGTQAAIALENARLYQQAQDYAQQLETSQLQLVQSEKMSALGNLVAGVAHEINNPLGFISGNLTEVRRSLQEIAACLQAYRETFPEPSEELAALVEELDVDFLLADLPKLLDSMQSGCQRIREISSSLRLFSRADTEAKFRANLHDGLNSTLLILKYRLKANESRPAIEVTCDYGELPAVECFPGQLNQVFMNILANAIDMFDELAGNCSFAAFTANPPQITIATRRLGADTVEICLSDNGKGMSEAVQAKIFERQFTTKAVGKGTGLGLAIAHQIVVGKHGGSLTVQSELGRGTQFAIRLPL